MGATEMTAINPGKARSGHVALWIAALVLSCAALLGLSAKAEAALVGNPGVFTATWSSGEMKQGNVAWPLGSLQNGGGNLTFQMNVNADGTFSVPGVDFAQIAVPGSYQSGSIGFLSQKATIQNIRLQPQATGAWGGSVNPLTGAFSIATPMKWRMFADGNSTSGLQNGQCDVNNSTTINASSAAAGGSAYQIAGDNGLVTAVADPISLPGSNDCKGQVIADSSSITSQTNTFFALPGSGNRMVYGLNITPAIKPPITPKLTVSPNPAATDDVVNFDANTSEILSGVKACASPSPAEAGCGYRWDFNGDGTIDEVTNGPTTTHVYGSPMNGTSKVTIFDVNGDSATASVNTEIQTRPVAQIDTNPPSTIKETVNAFTFSIPANPHNATTQCSVDNAAFSACNSGDNFTFVQADDTKGDHNFRVRGIIPGGITGPVASYDFTIDRIKPRVTINTKPVNPTTATSASFTFTADKPNTTLECQIDGGAWSACGTSSTGSKSYSGLTQSSGNPTENPHPHQFRVRATDSLGNVGGDGNPGGGAYDWDIDLTSPVPTLTTKPANPSNVVSPTFVWANNEAIQLAQCRLGINGNQGAWANCGSLTTKSYSNLADDSYDFGVRTLDIAGNWSAPVNYHWSLETVTPPLSITSTPARYSNRTSAQFLFNTEAGATARCQLDSQPVQDPCVSGVKYSYLSAGTHIFSVTSTDPALNETTRSYTWDIKTAKPAVQIQAASLPDASSVSADASFALTTANGNAECRLDSGAWNACTSNSTQGYSGLADGNHTFEVRAVDEFDNVSAIDAYSWLVLANAPEVSFGLTPDEKTNQSTGNFTFAVDTADNDVTTVCSLDGNESFDCGSPAVVTDLADGEHTFWVSATDTAGQTDTIGYDWTVKAKIPGLGFDSTPAAIANSTSGNFSFSSDEDPDVTYECRTDNGSFSACESPVTLSGLSQGPHSFTVRATDDVGNRATEAYLWKVDSIAPSVTIDQAPAATTQKVAELIRFHANESDATFACKLDSGSYASCASPALVKNLSAGVHSFSVKATDPAGNTSTEAVAAWNIEAPSSNGATTAARPNVAASATRTTAVASPKAATKTKAKASSTKKKAKSKKKAHAKKKHSAKKHRKRH